MTPPGLCSDTILFDTAVAGVGHGVNFDVWYAARHLPALRREFAPLACRVYASASCASLTAILEIDSVENDSSMVETSGELGAGVARTEQFIARSIGWQARPETIDIHATAQRAPIAYPVFFAVPDAREAEFNRWYDEEHLGILLGCADWLACRRFRITTPHPAGFTHLALHYLAGIAALTSPERDAARATPWRDRLAIERWFRGEYRVLHRILA
ncbi:MAG: hypothetical protein WCP99_03680 [Burkholderiales bacterium]